MPKEIKTHMKVRPVQEWRCLINKLGINAGPVDKGPGTEPAQRIESRETILLADDNFDVRWFIRTVLEEYYFNVIEAVDGQDAVRKFRENENNIDLLVFDITMPNMTGREAYGEIRKVKPDIKVLFTSGCDKNVFESGKIEKGAAFIPKPFSPVEFLKKVSEILRSSPLEAGSVL